MTYTLEALDADANVRDTFRVDAQTAGDMLILRVPTSMHADDRAQLAHDVRGGLGKKAPPAIVVVPDYVVACRLVPSEATDA